MHKPCVVYMDFDGVFNVPKNNSKEIKHSEIDTKSKYLQSKETIHWSQDVVNAFIDMLELTGAEMVWVTTWCDQHDIDTAANIMGFNKDNYTVAPPEFVQKARAPKREWTEWKRDFIFNDLSRQDRPYIWVDDEAIKYWANDLDWRFRSPHKFISPKSSIGLTIEQVEEMSQWLTEKTTDLLTNPA